VQVHTGMTGIFYWGRYPIFTCNKELVPYPSNDLVSFEHTLFPMPKIRDYGLSQEKPSTAAKKHRKRRSRGEPWEQKQVLTDRGPEFPRNEAEAKDHITAIKAEKLKATETSIARALNNVLKE
jgi:hypothetical protein